MSENKASVAPSIIKSVAAVACCVTLALTSTSITDKVCENRKAIAEKSGGSASVSSIVDDFAGDATSTDFTGDATDAVTDDASASADDTSATDDTSAAADDTSSDTSSQDKGAAKEITLTSGLSSTNKAEVLKYYKLVAAKNAKAGNYVTKMTMTSLDGGSGAVGGLISAFKPIATSALDKNSVTSDNLPGKPETILESDWESAKAVNDGKFTTVTIKLKDQTDGANGKGYEGTVGRSIGVLDGVQTALDNLPGVSADFANSKFALVYNDAYIKIKVNNATGELVKGANTWHYVVNVIFDNLPVKVTFISATLNGGKGTIDYTITH